MDGAQGPLKDAKGTVPGFEDRGPKCVMASSDSPAGPFINPVMCDWPAANSAGTFDPAVLVDDQEDDSVRVYAYWGMKSGDRCAEIDPNPSFLVGGVSRCDSTPALFVALQSR
jgi:hypothetical protein